MKKYFMSIVTIFITLLLISTVTAVPHNHSKPVLNLIDDIENKKDIIENEIFNNNNNNFKFISRGIIELLIQLIILIVQFVMEIINIIQNVISLINLIQNLIEAISILFQLIQDLIELIRSIFNPSQVIY